MCIESERKREKDNSEIHYVNKSRKAQTKILIMLRYM